MTLTNRSDTQKQPGLDVWVLNLVNTDFNLINSSSVSNGFTHLYSTFASTRHKHVSSISWEFWPYTSHMALSDHENKDMSRASDLPLWCCTAARLTFFKAVKVPPGELSTHTSTELSSTAAILPGLHRHPDLSCFQNKKDEWTLDVQRGRRVLAVRDIPAVWLVMCAKPGKLLASLASPPLVSSWWMAVVLATPPVVTTGTARSRVLLLVATELRTWPWGLPQTAWGWRRRRQINGVSFSHAQFHLSFPLANWRSLHRFTEIKPDCVYDVMI